MVSIGQADVLRHRNQVGMEQHNYFFSSLLQEVNFSGTATLIASTDHHQRRIPLCFPMPVMQLSEVFQIPWTAPLCEACGIPRISAKVLRELNAIYFLLLSQVTQLTRKRVKIFTDNQFAARIVAIGSSKIHLQALAMDNFNLFLVNSIVLEAQWIPRSLIY